MNRKQIIGMAIVVLGVLMVSTAQLTDILGPSAAKTITSLAAMLNSILGGFMTVLTTDNAAIQDAANTKGVESIQINKSAPQSLAAMAIDPANEKIEATAKDSVAVSKIAENGGQS